jgi:hypothetical protein
LRDVRLPWYSAPSSSRDRPPRMRSLPPLSPLSSSVGASTPSSTAPTSSSEKPSPESSSPESALASRGSAPPVGSKSSSGSSVEAGAGLASAARLSPPPARFDDRVEGIARGVPPHAPRA